MDDPGVSYRGSDGPVPNERQRVTSSRREGRERREGEKRGEGLISPSRILSSVRRRPRAPVLDLMAMSAMALRADVVMCRLAPLSLKIWVNLHRNKTKQVGQPRSVQDACRRQEREREGAGGGWSTTHCLMSEFLGSVRIRSKSAWSSSRSRAMTGSRPIISGIKP